MNEALLLPHQKRMIEERDELKKKLDSLIAFTFTKLYDELPRDERIRMDWQQCGMECYLSALQSRIDAWGN